MRENSPNLVALPSYDEVHHISFAKKLSAFPRPLAKLTQRGGIQQFHSFSKEFQSKKATTLEPILRS
jgi:hypothetical protein